MKPDCPNCHVDSCYHLTEAGQMEETSSEIEEVFEVDLGDDYDCDTCGFTYNHAFFYRDWNDEGDWYFGYRAGCYGGDSVLSGEENALGRVDEILKDIRQYPNWTTHHETVLRKFIGDS